jgi:hypothetical protein
VQVRQLRIRASPSDMCSGLVDGEMGRLTNTLFSLSFAMLVKFISILIITPSFTPIGLAVGFLGRWVGNVYIKAQLSVKREMSNAKAPILAQ